VAPTAVSLWFAYAGAPETPGTRPSSAIEVVSDALDGNVAVFEA
jgi:hypothetical protein